jgi:ATP-dependent Clp protease adaptor protein ClpS
MIYNSVLVPETETLEEVLTDLGVDAAGQYSLILHNDDYNTFDFVIDSLVEVCNHDPLQAEQCSIIVHFRGKCDVKIGSLDFIKPMKEELQNRGLSASIERQ